jgi:hypothetical protein
MDSLASGMAVAMQVRNGASGERLAGRCAGLSARAGALFSKMLRYRNVDVVFAARTAKSAAQELRGGGVWKWVVC